MDVGTVTALVVAGTGAVGAYTSYRLGKRGQENDKKQQAAAQTLQERIAAFDELESLNDRLEAENNRLRELVDEAEARGDMRLAAQGKRCRETLDQMTTAVATLQSLVTAEVVKASGDDALDTAKRHVDRDHPEHD